LCARVLVAYLQRVCVCVCVLVDYLQHVCVCEHVCEVTNRV